MIEKIIFNLIAFSLFIIIFFKIIRKNDANYFILLIFQAIGIGISFLEIKLGIDINNFLLIIRYIFSIITPVSIIILEHKNINFSEILSSILAKFFIIIKNDKHAKSVLINLVTKYPDSYIGHKLLAELYEKEGGMRKAIDEYVKLVDIKGNDYDSYFKIAELLKDLGQKNEAIGMLQNLLKTKPDSHEGALLLGELLCEQARFKEAENIYQIALKYRPMDYYLCYNLGIVYTMLSDFQMAKEMYEKAADINHLAYAANYSLGQIALMQGDFDIAEKYFKISLYDELESKSYYQLAKIYVLKAEKDKAIIFLNKAIELEPELLPKANKEKIFAEIREHITVSVKMDNDTKNTHVVQKDNNILKIEKLALEYLESTHTLVRDISENTEKQKIEQKVDKIFEENKKQKELEKEEKQKELGSN